MLNITWLINSILFGGLAYFLIASTSDLKGAAFFTFLGIGIGLISLFSLIKAFIKQNSDTASLDVTKNLQPKPKNPADQIRESAARTLQRIEGKALGKPLIAVHVGGSGLPLKSGSAFYLSCRKDSFAISHAVSDDEAILPYHKLLRFEVEGPGTEVTNAGLIGGGFGVEGALKGIATAALVNAATTKKMTNTFLRIVTAEGEAYFHFNDIEPAALRIAFSPAAVAVEANKSAATSGSSNRLASELQKLHQLKTEGVLTDDEYESAKKKMIG